MNTPNNPNTASSSWPRLAALAPSVETAAVLTRAKQAADVTRAGRERQVWAQARQPAAQPHIVEEWDEEDDGSPITWFAEVIERELDVANAELLAQDCLDAATSDLLQMARAITAAFDARGGQDPAMTAAKAVLDYLAAARAHTIRDDFDTPNGYQDHVRPIIKAAQVIERELCVDHAELVARDGIDAATYDLSKMARAIAEAWARSPARDSGYIAAEAARDYLMGNPV